MKRNKQLATTIDNFLGKPLREHLFSINCNQTAATYPSCSKLDWMEMWMTMIGLGKWIVATAATLRVTIVTLRSNSNGGMFISLMHHAHIHKAKAIKLYLGQIFQCVSWGLASKLIFL